METGGPGCASPTEIAADLAEVAEVDRTAASIYEDETGRSAGRDDIDHLDFDEDSDSTDTT